MLVRRTSSEWSSKQRFWLTCTVCESVMIQSPFQTARFMSRLQYYHYWWWCNYYYHYYHNQYIYLYIITKMKKDRGLNEITTRMADKSLMDKLKLTSFTLNEHWITISWCRIMNVRMWWNLGTFLVKYGILMLCYNTTLRRTTQQRIRESKEDPVRYEVRTLKDSSDYFRPFLTKRPHLTWVVSWCGERRIFVLVKVNYTTSTW